MRSPLPHCAAFGLAVALLSGCASRTAASLPELEGGAELVLKRGSSLSVVNVKPPHAIGEDVSLRFEGGSMRGSAGARRVELTLETDLISGDISPGGGERELAAGRLPPMRRGGAVELDVRGDASTMQASGVWDGERVNFTFTPEAVKGTVIELRRTTHCQYVLDKADGNGRYRGTSNCGGVAEETILEIPPKLSASLRPSTLVALLMTLFAAAPMSRMELPLNHR